MKVWIIFFIFVFKVFSVGFLDTPTPDKEDIKQAEEEVLKKEIWQEYPQYKGRSFEELPPEIKSGYNFYIQERAQFIAQQKALKKAAESLGLNKQEYKPLPLPTIEDERKYPEEDLPLPLPKEVEKKEIKESQKITPQLPVSSAIEKKQTKGLGIFILLLVCATLGFVISLKLKK